MVDINQETYLGLQPDAVPIEGTKKILYQMENCICQIFKEKGEKGTGFFCNISYCDQEIPFLITNNHVLNKNDIENNKKIELIINNESREIKIDNMRKKYTNEELDVTLIEIRPEKDEIKNVMELDEEDINKNINILEKIYRKKSIYILHYPKGKLSTSYGLINGLTVDGKKIEHCCNTDTGSSGSPILSLETYKIIGIHHSGNNRKNFGTFIKCVIEELKKNEYEKNITYHKNIVELPDIMNLPNESKKEIEVFNNIIYYAENKNNIELIYEDSDYFERMTPGAFILCNSIYSLKLIRREILKQTEKDKRMTFNFIISGHSCGNLIFINKDPDFKKWINNICIYSLEQQNYSILKEEYKNVCDVCDTRKGIVDFINKFSSKEIKPFPITKVLTYQDYLDKYKTNHFKISQFYGDLTLEEYRKNLNSIKKLINEEDKSKELWIKYPNKILNGFLTFNLTEDLDNLDKKIINEYTKNSFYGDLNKWLIHPNINYYNSVAYFAARLMYSANQYAIKNKKYFIDERNFYRGVKMFYSDLLAYERAKGKIIFFSAFETSYGDIATEDKEVAKRWAGRSNSKSLYTINLKFSVIFIIKNNNKKSWISNGIKISDISSYKSEKQILYLPFSFYYVNDVKIDIENYLADIYLETIGKNEILEEKIKLGKEIEYNEMEGMMQIKK